MDFMTEEIMIELINEICEYDCQSWSSVAMYLNLYGAVTSGMPFANCQPAIVMLKALFVMMMDKKVPITEYKDAVQRECPAALSRPFHKKYIVQRNDDLPEMQVTKPQSKCVILSITSCAASTFVNASIQDLDILELCKELVAHGITMEDIRLLIKKETFNSFVASIANYNGQSVVEQICRYIMFLRKDDYTLSDYKWIVEHCTNGTLVLMEKTHARILENIVSSKPSFAL